MSASDNADKAARVVINLTGARAEWFRLEQAARDMGPGELMKSIIDFYRAQQSPTFGVKRNGE